ncbi:MAG TPA: hypothetical protein VKP30_17000 [Polyangiaceae bacterium]|nr:hypothetical protein [Polyangiaceae bacterium]
MSNAMYFRSFYRGLSIAQQSLVLLGSGVGIGCGHQDGVVGAMHARDAGGDNQPGDTVFETDFVDNSGVWTVETALSNASARFGQTDSAARDGKVVSLTFPGDASKSAADAVGPAYVTQLETLGQFAFGTLRTRVKFGACGPNEETIQSILGYFSDGSDSDQDGLTDDIEIDLQIACSSPGFVYLTVFTDYDQTAGSERFRKLSHIVDFATGTEYDSLADNSDEFVPTGVRPSLVRPGLVNANSYYELGFTWQSDAVRFFLVDGAEELTLWNLNDAAHVPQHPIHLMYNLWHPDSHWFPVTGAADFPGNDVVMRVDWLRYSLLDVD